MRLREGETCDRRLPEDLCPPLGERMPAELATLLFAKILDVLLPARGDMKPALLVIDCETWPLLLLRTLLRFNVRTTCTDVFAFALRRRAIAWSSSPQTTSAVEDATRGSEWHAWTWLAPM